VADVHSTFAFAAKNRYVIPLLAFLLPLAVRAIPEVLIGPYIVGFDTMAFYVPNTLAWLYGGVDVWGYLAVAPLFYTILMSIVATGIPLIIALKVIPPLLLGFLGLSIYYYARKGLGWSSIKSLAPALLGTVYFVALRVSWDMLRNELGIIFLFVVLTLLTQIRNSSWKRYLLLSLTMMAVVLSHQLAAVIMLAIVAFTIVYELFRKDLRKPAKLIAATLPAAVFFLVIYFIAVVPAGFQDYTASAESPLANWLGFSSYPAMLLTEAGFFLYCFLPLLPLAILSFKKLCDFQLRCWLLLSLILLLIPFAFVSPYRWLLLLIYPFAFFVTESVSRLKTIKWKRFKLTVHRIAILYLIVSTGILSFGYIFKPPEQPFVYFSPQYINYYSYQIPTSMQQNTISIADFQGTTNALQWFRDNENTSALLLTHTAFYSWALLSLDTDRIRNYGFDDPAKAAALAMQEGHTQIFLVWWINGGGWYAQSTLPPVFQEVYRSERIAIYFYNP
jgi:hypothetical protein